MNERTARQLRAIAEADKILLSAEDKQIERINDALNQSFVSLHSQLKQKWSKHGTGSTFAQDRALLLIADIKESLNVLDSKSKRTKAIKKQYKELLRLADTTGTTLGDRLLAEYPKAPGGISVESVASLQLDAVAIASQEAYDRLLQHGEKFAGDASIVIQQGLIQNWGIAKTARALASTLGTTKVRAEMIARTESAKASTRAAKKRYLEEGVDLVQHIATQDPRVCKYCAAKAGKIYPAESYDPIQHPNCRCFIVPVRREWIEEGLFDAEWAQQHSVETIAKAKGSNPGPSPFEKAVGLKSAPVPFWKPGKSSPSQRSTSKKQNVGFANSIYSLDSRVDGKYFEEALDTLVDNQNLGNFKKFQKFITEAQIKVAVYKKDSRPDVASRTKIAREMYPNHGGAILFDLNKDESWEAVTEYLAVNLLSAPKKTSNGYTNSDVRHVVIKNRGDGAPPKGEKIRAQIKKLVKTAREDYELSGVPLVPEWSNSGSLEGAQAESTVVTLVHELGHQVHFRGGTKDVPPKAKRRMLTDYSDVNDREWFAENFVAWLIAPNEYRNFNPDGYDFVESTMKAALNEPI